MTKFQYRPDVHVSVQILSAKHVFQAIIIILIFKTLMDFVL